MHTRQPANAVQRMHFQFDAFMYQGIQLPLPSILRYSLFMASWYFACKEHAAQQPELRNDTIVRDWQCPTRSSLRLAFRVGVSSPLSTDHASGSSTKPMTLSKPCTASLNHDNISTYHCCNCPNSQ